MIRRILHAELSDVRALASNAASRIGNAIAHHVYVDSDHRCGVVILGRRMQAGAGYIISDPHPDHWPDGARMLTIGRVTLAAWGGRTS